MLRYCFCFLLPFSSIFSEEVATNNAVAEPKVVVSLTTTAVRIPLSIATLHSLIDQTYKPDRIILNIATTPYFDNDEGLKEEDIPEEIKHLETLNLIDIRLTENIGPFTKLAPTLREYFDEKETMIITADDDVGYAENWLEGLVKTSKAYPNCVVAYSAREILFDEYSRLEVYSKCPILLPQQIVNPKQKNYIVRGACGVLYKPKFFSEEVFNYKHYRRSTPYADDIWISAHLNKNEIPLRVLVHPKEGFPRTYIWHDKALFWRFNRNGGNDLALEQMRDYFAAEPRMVLRRKYSKNPILTWVLEQLKRQEEEESHDEVY